MPVGTERYEVHYKSGIAFFYYKLQPSQSLSSNQSTAGSLSRHWREPLMVWREILVANPEPFFSPLFFFSLISPLLPFTGFPQSSKSDPIWWKFSWIYRHKLRQMTSLDSLTRPVILLLICFSSIVVSNLSAIIVTGAYFNIVFKYSPGCISFTLLLHSSDSFVSKKQPKWLKYFYFVFCYINIVMNKFR